MGAQEEHNSQYLAAIFQELRLRLRRVAGDDAIAPEIIAEAVADSGAAAVMDPAPVAIALGRRFQLSELELGILMLCVAMEVDPLIPELCDRAQGDKGYAFPTFALAFQLFGEVRWDVLSIDAPLRYWQLLHLHAPQPLPLPQTLLKADERIVNRIMGYGQLDHRLESLVSPLVAFRRTAGTGPRIAPSQQAVVADLCQSLSQQDPGMPLPIVQLVGANDQSKQQVAQQVAAQFGAELYGLMGELIPTATQEFTEFLRLWDRETFLSRVALYIDTQEVRKDTPNRMALRRFLSQGGGLIFVDSGEVRLPLNRQTLTYEVGKPTPLEQRQAWVQVLGTGAERQAAVLTSQFNLNVDEIGAIAAIVHPPRSPLAKGGGSGHPAQSAFSKGGSHPPRSPLAKGGGSGPPPLQGGGRGGRGSSVLWAGDDDPVGQTLWNACLNRTRPRLEALAQRLETKATWDQLVLPERAMDGLRQMVNQVRLRGQVYDDWGLRSRMNRGLGVSAMFAGESGTGKTMAAEVIANELNLHLYRIDLSAVVSKYIGETEKNLRRLFDAAEEGGAILFFDEADALFGKRSDVKDSHDRYANIEINYLLQRIEAYRGVAILATNLKKTLDAAFLRRLRFLISFPFPSRAYRMELWRKAFPEKMPTGEIDYQYLGQFHLTGGAIHTAAVNAAFVAAGKDRPVGMGEILASIRTEYEKLERSTFEEEFEWGEEKQGVGNIDHPLSKA